MKPVLVIHGGAGSRIPSPEKARILHNSLQRILEAVYPSLKRGTSAMQAVVHAVELLENDPMYNAGLGSRIQSDGKIRMSASLMDGYNRRFSACVNVEGVKNPIHLAKKLMQEEARVLAAQGAQKFAREKKLAFASAYTSERREEFRRFKKGRFGTVGAVALDKKGHLAAATSTGGRGFEYPGRVSDSPTVAGNFANRDCAVSATGTGEQIVDFSVASALCTLVASGKSLSTVTKNFMKDVKKADAQFGFIALDRQGRVVATTNTEHLIWAMRGPD